MAWSASRPRLGERIKTAESSIVDCKVEDSERQHDS